MPLRFVSFLFVGLANTAIGVGVIAGGILAGLPPLAANASGFLVGLCVSFVLNSRFTFGVRTGNGWMVLRYLVAFLVAYGCNLGTVLLLDHLFPGQVVLTHVAGIVPYTIVFFLLAEVFVFGNSHVRPGGIRGRRT
jgi:putative flippase GtrA